MNMMDKIVEVANDKSMDKPFIFQIGQKVRVRKYVLEDGQTKEYWIKEKVIILKQIRTMISKNNYYRLQHPNGTIDDFQEDELDHRFIKNKHLQSE